MITPWSQHWSSMTSEKHWPPSQKDWWWCVLVCVRACVCVCVCVLCVMRVMSLLCISVWLNCCDLFQSNETGQAQRADKGNVLYTSMEFAEGADILQQFTKWWNWSFFVSKRFSRGGEAFGRSWDNKTLLWNPDEICVMLAGLSPWTWEMAQRFVRVIQWIC